MEEIIVEILSSIFENAPNTKLGAAAATILLVATVVIIGSLAISGAVSTP